MLMACFLCCCVHCLYFAEWCKKEKKCGRSFWRGIGEMIYFCNSSMYVNTTKLCCVCDVTEGMSAKSYK